MRSSAHGVALVGTTASGKSRIVHQLALEAGDVEIATIDSMTVYREMDLGTAKATAAEREQVVYHLLDLVDPSEEFAVAQFQAAAREAERRAYQRAHHLVYVGGTGLYGRAVIDQLEIPPQFPLLRAELEVRAADDPVALYDELVRVDSVAASRMEPTNTRRIVRALEVTFGTGRPFSSFGPGLREYPTTNFVQVGLRIDLAELDEKIEARFRDWMDQGLLEEVRRLSGRPRGLSRTARQAVGYRELLRHVEDGYELADAVSDAIIATRRLARRQRSWFARDRRIEWYDTPEQAAHRLRTVLSGGGPIVRE